MAPHCVVLSPGCPTTSAWHLRAPEHAPPRASGLYLSGYTLGEPFAIHTLNEEVLWLGVLGVFVGGLLGLLWGVLLALRVLISPRA